MLYAVQIVKLTLFQLHRLQRGYGVKREKQPTLSFTQTHTQKHTHKHKLPVSLPVLWLIQWDIKTWRSVTTSLHYYVYVTKNCVHTSIGFFIFLSVSADLSGCEEWCVCVCVRMHLFQDNISSPSQRGRQQLFYSSPRNRKSFYTQLNMLNMSTIAVSNCAVPKWSKMSGAASRHLALHMCHNKMGSDSLQSCTRAMICSMIWFLFSVSVASCVNSWGNKTINIEHTTQFHWKTFHEMWHSDRLLLIELRNCRITQHVFLRKIKKYLWHRVLEHQFCSHSLSLTIAHCYW